MSSRKDVVICDVEVRIATAPEAVGEIAVLMGHAVNGYAVCRGKGAKFAIEGAGDENDNGDIESYAKITGTPNL